MYDVTYSCWFQNGTVQRRVENSKVQNCKQASMLQDNLYLDNLHEYVHNECRIVRTIQCIVTVYMYHVYLKGDL